MADEKDRSFAPSTVASNRAQMQGLGVGRQEMDDDFAADLDASDNRRIGDLGEGTPANVDIHNLGQPDNPEQEWGEPAGEGATFSSNNTRKGLATEAERGQGAKTRKLNKDIISRRI